MEERDEKELESCSVWFLEDLTRKEAPKWFIFFIQNRKVWGDDRVANNDVLRNKNSVGSLGRL